MRMRVENILWMQLVLNQGFLGRMSGRPVDSSIHKQTIPVLKGVYTNIRCPFDVKCISVYLPKGHLALPQKIQVCKP
jgi:hypothetical protein